MTDRVVLPVSSSIFDPLGLASPFTIRIRLILRLIWQKALNTWDEQIPEDVPKQYLEWLQDVPDLKELLITNTMVGRRAVELSFIFLQTHLRFEV